MHDFQDKRALITGAASGIGRAIALRLAREGTHVYLLDIDEVGLAETVAAAGNLGVEAVGVRCDLSQPHEISAAVRELLARWGHIDVLVNNAGINFYGKTLTMSAEQWDRLLAINLHAPIQLTRELLPTLLGRPDAHLVNIASICGYVASSRSAAYHVSKFALVGFTEAMRAEFCRQGLGVTAICPGPVKTNLYRYAEIGEADHPIPNFPDWICSTPEEVAERTISGMYWNSGMVLVGWMAWGTYYLKRFFPWLIDLAQTWRWGKSRPAAPSEKRPIADEPPPDTAGRESRPVLNDFSELRKSA